ncbi:zinc finger and SCAN domain-containing protein 10 isoform X2 [Folsomia candida]|uniref:zinc finger and SCAN domain-containing protein 10 isoform X2 n=1 Tax=Folsomia candida TaxID=158441 RepID=UPI0016051491|nr:zinc finger and SCAN domain-containing protein 10 isoform X2 [Folsomia candida]
MESTCFFCHLTYCSTLTLEAKKKMNKLFLTYLEAINLSTVEIQDAVNLAKVPFHACPPCLTTLQKISSYILQLEEEMKKICITISQHCGDGGLVGRLAELRGHVMARSRPKVELNLKGVTSTYQPSPVLFTDPDPSKLPPAQRRILPAPQIIQPAPQIIQPAQRLIHPAQRRILPAPSIIDPATKIISPAPQVIPPAPQIIQPAQRLIQPAPRLIHPVDPKPSEIMTVLVDPKPLKLENDAVIKLENDAEIKLENDYELELETDLELKLETDPAKEAEVDLDDFMINPDGNDDMDVDLSEDPLSVSTEAPPPPPKRRLGRPLKYNPYPPGWRKTFGGVDVTRVDHRYTSGFQCGRCKFKHQIWKHMKNHILQKHGSVLEAFKFKCSSCGVLYATEELLSTHITYKHTVHSCGNCDFTCTFLSQLDRHISETHPERLKCPKCGKIVSSLSQFDMHVENCRVGVEMDDTKFLRPTSVQTSATTWTYLDVDMSQVDDKILCSQCDFSYPKKYHVMKHIRATHTKHLPFRCPNTVCGWPFANQTLLDEHLASTGHGPQVCDICGKVVISKHTLQNHVRLVHEKQDRFICTTCGKIERVFSFGNKVTKDCVNYLNIMAMGCHIKNYLE